MAAKREPATQKSAKDALKGGSGDPPSEGTLRGGGAQGRAAKGKKKK